MFILNLRQTADHFLLEFSFKDAEGNYKLIGKAVESKIEKKFNDVFGVDEHFPDNEKFYIKQKIKILNTSLKTIHVQADYQVCRSLYQCKKKNSLSMFLQLS